MLSSRMFKNLHTRRGELRSGVRKDWYALIDRLQCASDREIILQFHSDSLIRQSFEDREDELDREQSARDETAR